MTGPKSLNLSMSIIMAHCIHTVGIQSIPVEQGLCNIKTEDTIYLRRVL